MQWCFGWEGVGLCSCFLIGGWFKEARASAAASKALVVNRGGGCGFDVGSFWIFEWVGTVN